MRLFGTLFLAAVLPYGAGLLVPLRSPSPIVMQMPDEVRDIIPVAVQRSRQQSRMVEANWEALRTCYPTEEAAVAAVKLSTAVILPYGFDADNRARNIAGSYAVLQDMFADEAEVIEIITKNPGVLGCQPKGLKSLSCCDSHPRVSKVYGIPRGVRA